MPTCMSAAPRSAGPPLRGRHLQSVLVDPHGLAEPTLGDPDVGPGDGAAHEVGEVPGLLQARHAVGIRAVRCVEVAGRPVRESQERHRRPAARVVVRADKVEGLLGEGDAAGHVAEEPGQSGTVDGDRRRKRAEIDPRPRRPSRAASQGPPLSPLIAASHRSTSCRRDSTPSTSLRTRRDPANALLSTGLTRIDSSAVPPASDAASPPVAAGASPGSASSMRSAARPKSSPARAWRMASDRSPFCSYHSVARRCSISARPGSSSSRRARSTSANRW